MTRPSRIRASASEACSAIAWQKKLIHSSQAPRVLTSRRRYRYWSERTSKYGDKLIKGSVSSPQSISCRIAINRPMRPLPSGERMQCDFK